ncbi:hypothetical protein ACQYRI_04655 [Salmonella enterica]
MPVETQTSSIRPCNRDNDLTRLSEQRIQLGRGISQTESIRRASQGDANHSPMLNNLSGVQNCVDAFNKNSDQDHLAENLYHNQARISLPPVFLNTKLSQEAEEIKDIMGILIKHISPEDRPKFDKACASLMAANGNVQKERKAKNDVSSLLSTYGKTALNAFASEYIDFCRGAWKYKHEGYDPDVKDEVIFSTSFSACHGMFERDIKTLTDPDTHWETLVQVARYFQDTCVTVAKTILNHDAKAPDETDAPKTPPPQPPAPPAATQPVAQQIPAVGPYGPFNINVSGGAGGAGGTATVSHSGNSSISSASDSAASEIKAILEALPPDQRAGVANNWIAAKFNYNLAHFVNGVTVSDELRLARQGTQPEPLTRRHSFNEDLLISQSRARSVVLDNAQSSQSVAALQHRTSVVGENVQSLQILPRNIGQTSLDTVDSTAQSRQSRSLALEDTPPQNAPYQPDEDTESILSDEDAATLLRRMNNGSSSQGNIHSLSAGPSANADIMIHDIDERSEADDSVFIPAPPPTVDLNGTSHVSEDIRPRKTVQRSDAVDETDSVFEMDSRLGDQGSVASDETESISEADYLPAEPTSELPESDSEAVLLRRTQLDDADVRVNGDTRFSINSAKDSEEQDSLAPLKSGWVERMTRQWEQHFQQAGNNEFRPLSAKIAGPEFIAHSRENSRHFAGPTSPSRIQRAEHPEIVMDYIKTTTRNVDPLNNRRAPSLPFVRRFSEPQGDE